jgi:hypothetical protein
VLFASCLAAVVLAKLNSTPSASQAVASPTLASLGPAASSGKSPSAASMANAGPVPAAPPGFTRVFADSFGGPAGSAPSEQNWFYDIGTNYGNNEIDQTTNSTRNVYLNGSGDLVIQANDNNGSWTSGRIESARDDFEAPAGGKLEMTASIEQPDPANGLGYWPAFWALGTPTRTGTGTWPTAGELDMMEDVNAISEASQTLHDDAGSTAHPFISCPDTTSTCQTGFHTYSVIIDRTNPSAEFLEFLMDGKVEVTITEAEVGTATWQAAIDHAFYIILNVAIGGKYPDTQCDCTTPTSATSSGAAMKVAYVAVYEDGGNTTPTATPKATGQVTGFQQNCLSNYNSLDTAYNPIILNTCDGSAGQQWSTYSDGTLRAQGGCLDLHDGGKTSGTDVNWYPCDGNAAQVWTPEPSGELYNAYSGLCLTDPGTYDGSPLTIEACQASAKQKWSLP